MAQWIGTSVAVVGLVAILVLLALALRTWRATGLQSYPTEERRRVGEVLRSGGTLRCEDLTLAGALVQSQRVSRWFLVPAAVMTMTQSLTFTDTVPALRAFNVAAAVIALGCAATLFVAAARNRRTYDRALGAKTTSPTAST